MDNWQQRYQEDVKNMRRIEEIGIEAWKHERKQQDHDKLRQQMPWWFPTEIFLWSADMDSWKEFVYKFPVVLVLYTLTLGLAMAALPIQIFYYCFALPIWELLRAYYAWASN